MFMKYDCVDNQFLNNFSSFLLTQDVYNDFMAYDLDVRQFELKPELKHDDNICSIKDKILNNGMTHICLIPNAHKSSIFSPKQEDTLFWCIFIHKFGKTEYDVIESKYKNHEINEKMNIVEYLKENRTIMKTNKITKTDTQEIMGKLMTNNITDLQTIHGICAFYKIHIVVVNSNKMTYIDYDYSNTDDNKNDDIFVIFKSDSLMSKLKCKYFIKVSINKGDILNILENYVKFESFEKPFNGISTYKLTDLEIIHKKLGLEKKKQNKMELFSQINLAVV